jgi:hypothetical protein
MGDVAFLRQREWHHDGENAQQSDELWRTLQN